MSGYYSLPIPSRPWTRAQTQLRQQQYDMAVSLSRPYAHYLQQYHQVAMTSYSMATSKEAQLASFVPQIAGQSEMDGCVQVWRMPKELSQSRLGDRTQSSNACTIIALKMAEQLHRQCVFFPANDYRFVHANMRAHQLPRFTAAAGNRTPLVTLQQPMYRFCGTARYAAGEDERSHETARMTSLAERRVSTAPLVLVNALSNAIVDGNVIHESSVRLRANGEQNFTIPDAIAACDHVFREIDFSTVTGPIWRNLAAYIRRALGRLSNNRAHVFLMLIAYERSILLVYQPHNCTIGMADSHSHGFDEGAVLACAAISRLDEFCLWMVRNIFPECAYTPDAIQEFEISAIRFAARADCGDCVSFTEAAASSTNAYRAGILQAPMTSAGKQLGKRQSSPTRRWTPIPLKHFKPNTKEQSSSASQRRRFH